MIDAVIIALCVAGVLYVMGAPWWAALFACVAVGCVIADVARHGW